MRGRRRTGAVLLCCLPPIAASGQTLRDDRLAAADRVAVRIEHFTGPVERHCGIYLLASRDATVERRAVTTALQCLATAKRRGRAAWALWQTGYGIEGPGFAGVAISPVSDPHLVSAGVGMGLAVTLSPCLMPRVQKDATIACRNLREPIESADVAAAIEELRRDVVRTAGDTRGRLVERATQLVTERAAPDHPGFFPAVVDEVQRAVEADVHDSWPRCPIHHDHGLEHRDRYWLCQRDGAFIARLGDLPRRRTDRQ